MGNPFIKVRILKLFLANLYFNKLLYFITRISLMMYFKRYIDLQIKARNIYGYYALAFFVCIALQRILCTMNEVTKKYALNSAWVRFFQSTLLTPKNPVCIC